MRSKHSTVDPGAAARFVFRLLLVFHGLVGVAWAGIGTVRVASGLTLPVFVTAPAGDPRLFIVEQGGTVRILRNGQVLPQPFLDLRAELGGAVSGNDERGLLGLAFPPDFADTGVFYVNFTRFSNTHTIIARYRVDSRDPDHALDSSREVLLDILQPFANHKGGTVAFGPDGMLYIGMGDGGAGGDPLNNAQTDDTPLGKMLRIDVAGGPGTRYGIPSDNPFAGEKDPMDRARDEIWAKGLRNPYRFSFDRETGDLYIADVGQNQVEEVDVQPASSRGGENYGWRIMEGSRCYEPASCDPAGLTLPVHEYSHGGTPFRCSVTGGYVYRGAMSQIQGHYFFADFCSGQIWNFVWDGAGGVRSFQERTAELSPDEGSLRNISGFGEDGIGELYIVARGTGRADGEVFRLVETTPAN